ncbi:MAG TPA: DUF2987 domain-containing protein [Azospirillaceae bacterium]|nr:DUF2987 domain-containing protein [Azospirillaceae bacterium]
MTRLFSPLFLAAFLLAGTAHAQEPAPGHNQIPYKDLSAIAKRIGEVKTPIDRLLIQTRAKPKDEKRAPDSVAMVIKAKAGDIKVPIAADGAFSLPIDPALEAENPMIDVNVPKGQLGIEVNIRAKPLGQAFRYADAAAAMDQFDALIEEQAGMMALMAPSAKAFGVKCGADCKATLALAAGDKVIAAGEGGIVPIPRDKKLAKENPAITVSHPVEAALIRTK